MTKRTTSVILRARAANPGGGVRQSPRPGKGRNSHPDRWPKCVILNRVMDDAAICEECGCTTKRGAAHCCFTVTGFRCGDCCPVCNDTGLATEEGKHEKSEGGL